MPSLFIFYECRCLQGRLQIKRPPLINQRRPSEIGARGRNRTGTPCGGGFSYHFDFRRHHANARCSWSGARLHHSFAALGARRLLSTPSEESFDPRAWLGISSDLCPGPSPSLTGFTSGVSSGGLKFGLSPLRLPISPPGQNRKAVYNNTTSYYLLRTSMITAGS